MMNKRQYCEALVESACHDLGIDQECSNSAIYSSSKLAVALEFLGKLSETEMEYSKGRGGVVSIYYDKEVGEVFSLSQRELINLLPE